MRAIYNGVDLMASETHYFDWQPVYDPEGVDYLYTRVGFSCRSIINGQSSIVKVQGPFINYGFDEDTILESGGVTSRSAPGTDGPAFGTPPAGVGIEKRSKSTLRGIKVNPIVPEGVNFTNNILQTIRHRLCTPQGQLYIFWGTGMESGIPPAGTDQVPGTGVPNGGVILAPLFLQSPDAGQRCDCKNGPFPKMLSCTAAMGDASTLLVDWAVETFVKEAADNSVLQSRFALLSNRFSQVHSVDDNGFTTITTTGLAIHRTDYVYSVPRSPDEDRSQLFMPIPQGFVRTINYVRGRPDVTGVEYSFTDRQVPVNFVAGPYTRAASINVAHSQSIAVRPDVLGTALTTYERFLSIRANREIARDKEKEREEKERKKAKAPPIEHPSPPPPPDSHK